MASKETEAQEKVELYKIDQRCISALIPEPSEGGVAKTSLQQAINWAMHESARNACGYERMDCICYAELHEDSIRYLQQQKEERGIDAFAIHNECDVKSPFAPQILKWIDQNPRDVTWVIVAGQDVGRVIRYPKDAEKIRASIYGGYILNHMVNFRTQGIEGDVYLEIPARGKFLRDGVVIRYDLISVYPSIQSPGYADVYIREVTFDARTCHVKTRALYQAIEQVQAIEMDYQGQEYEFDYPEIGD